MGTGLAPVAKAEAVNGYLNITLSSNYLVDGVLGILQQRALLEIHAVVSAKGVKHPLSR